MYSDAGGPPTGRVAYPFESDWAGLAQEARKAYTAKRAFVDFSMQTHFWPVPALQFLCRSARGATNVAPRETIAILFSIHRPIPWLVSACAVNFS